jgi:K+-sensing histidine kinase KdpD
VRLGESFSGEMTRPWYRMEPGSAVVLAACLFVGISLLQWFIDGSGQAIAVLYVLPVALMAVTMGQRGGLASAAACFGVFAVFEIFHSSGDIDAEGWVVRAVAMFLLGGLLGRATDQTNMTERVALEEQQRRCRLEEANHRYAEALEINDSIVQELVAAKWMIERGQADKAIDVLTATIDRGERMVAGLLPTRVTPQTDQPLAMRSVGHLQARRSLGTPARTLGEVTPGVGDS